MKYKLKDIIPSLDYYELLKIQKDLQQGGIHLNKLVSDEIQRQKNTNNKCCTVCMKSLDPKAKAFTLTFGPADFKKKASFCELDCLTYFTNKIKEQKLEAQQTI